jgi:DNA helicase II / ATP-dependent DNA helicase PcrA
MANRSNHIPPSPEQQAVIAAREGQFAVYATAGSGKTKTLCDRYAALLAEGEDPEEILCLTFTATASKEMKTRLGVDAKARFSRPCGPMTCHSLALHFATREGDKFPFKLNSYFPLATEGQAAKLLGESSRAENVKFHDLRSFVSRMRRRGIRPQAAIDAAENSAALQIARAYLNYETRSRAAGVLDFDSMLLEMVTLLESDIELRDRWSYKWVFTDESQDSNEIQWRLIRLVSGKHGNIMSFGDFSQSIFSFIDAEPELFLNFNDVFPFGHTLYLGQNFRSSQKLVAFHKEVLPVKNELCDRLFSTREIGSDPEYARFACRADEVEYVTNQAKVAGESVAILSRTNIGLRAYEESLSRNGVRYHLLGKSGFYAQSEIRNAMAFIQCAVSPFDGAVLTAIRAPFAPNRYIRKKELVDHLQQQKKEAESSFMGDRSYIELLEDYRCKDEQQNRNIQALAKFIRGLRKFHDVAPDQAVGTILTELQAVKYYEEEESNEADNSPVENLKELIKTASRFSSLREFLDYVRKIQNASRAKKGVALSTIHGAKGKEWGTVFVVQVQEGVIPHKRSESVEEESRLFYVAVSRAAKRLVLSYNGAVSRFIEKFVHKLDEEKNGNYIRES